MAADRVNGRRPAAAISRPLMLSVRSGGSNSRSGRRPSREDVAGAFAMVDERWDGGI